MSKPGRTALVSAAIILLTVIGAGPASAATGNPGSVYTESFEEGFGEWEPASDGHARDWEITHDRCEDAKDGKHCLRYFLDGTHDDGTIWVERRFPVPLETRSIDMDFWLWNEFDSSFGGWNVVAYIAPERPTEEFDFTIVGGTQDGLGWQQYHHSWQLPPEGKAGEVVWIAFGISAVWETVRTHPVDLVTVSMA